MADPDDYMTWPEQRRADMIPAERVERLLAWLLRNEGVEPEVIERAVESARFLRVGESIALMGDAQAPMRRAFVQEQSRLLARPGG